MTRREAIEKAIRVLRLDVKFPHTHISEWCYSYDGHRTDLICDIPSGLRVCNVCAGDRYDSFLSKILYVKDATEWVF